jgi:hypothetical protein
MMLNLHLQSIRYTDDGFTDIEQSSNSQTHYNSITHYRKEQKGTAGQRQTNHTKNTDVNK